MAELNDDELLDALGVEVATIQTASRTPFEERIIAGFEDISIDRQAFVFFKEPLNNCASSPKHEQCWRTLTPMACSTQPPRQVRMWMT